ncbi:MAG: MBL fold metallo-hydrolase, partial [Thermodesulfobacteriota bacterium]
MEIKFYGYNTFIIKSSDKTIAIDPGADLYFFRFKSLIPKKEWKDITHLFVTHGDPDHHWYTDKVAESSNAAVICNKSMVREKNGSELMLGPRERGLAFTKTIQNLHTITTDETIQLDDMRITGIKSTHGPITFKLGPFSKTLHPGPKERIGYGSIGFKINIDQKTIVNLGDTLLHETAWKKFKNPDVLMIPIGGKIPHNTMDETE